MNAYNLLFSFFLLFIPFTALADLKIDKPEFSLNIGAGKLKNTDKVLSAEIESRMQVIVIPIKLKEPNGGNMPVLVLSAIAKGMFSVSSSSDNRVNLKSGFAGIHIGNQHGSASVAVNKKDFVITMSAYKKLTNVLRIKGTVIHHKTHQSDELPWNQNNSTRINIGADYKINCKWVAGISYETGNRTPQHVENRILLSLGYRPGCKE